MDPTAVTKFIQENIRIRKINRNGQNPSEIKNNSFGTIHFQGFGQETQTNAPYTRVRWIDDRTTSSLLEPADEKLVKDVWTLMKHHWKMPDPKLIISVTGGAQGCYMKKRQMSSFKRGLVKAATSSGAWIITGGTKTGVMEIVGEAAREYMLENGSSVQDLVVLGIATWGIVDNKKCLRNNSREGKFPAYYNIGDLAGKSDGNDSSKIAPLDPNHTHFILVDDGSKDYGKEIGFRSAFESYMSRKYHQDHQETESAQTLGIPVVTVVVEGGINTLKTASEAIEKKIPVVVIADTGRAANCITDAARLAENKVTDEMLTDLIIKHLSLKSTKKKKVPTATLR